VRIKKKKPAAKHPPELIAACATRLRDRKPTPFSGEGALVAVVRSRRCLAGWPFARADEFARELVLAALKQIGAVRPKWIDGQPFLTSDAKTCPTCGEEFVRLYGPGVDRGQQAGKARYCSFSCLRESHRARQLRPDVRNRKREWAATKTAEADPVICANPACGSSFHPAYDNPTQKYCSLTCFHAVDAAERHPPRSCQTCGELFTPPNGERGRDRVYCSRKCSDAARGGNPPRPCDHCGTIYKPVNGAQGAKSRWCSRTCFYEYRRAQKASVFECEAID